EGQAVERWRRLDHSGGERRHRGPWEGTEFTMLLVANASANQGAGNEFNHIEGLLCVSQRGSECELHVGRSLLTSLKGLPHCFLPLSKTLPTPEPRGEAQGERGGGVWEQRILLSKGALMVTSTPAQAVMVRSRDLSILSSCDPPAVPKYCRVVSLHLSTCASKALHFPSDGLNMQEFLGLKMIDQTCQPWLLLLKMAAAAVRAPCDWCTSEFPAARL
ncbi:hypothetical protein KUCAC02_020490, partial [Chaenocephalus aceratus]